MVPSTVGSRSGTVCARGVLVLVAVCMFAESGTF